MSLSRFKKSIIIKLRNYILIVVFKTLNLTFGGTLINVTMNQIKDFKQSGLFGKKTKLDISEVYLKTKEAYNLDANGYYFKASNLRREIIEHVYLSNNVDLLSWQPKWLSSGYNRAIGHKALIGHLLSAQEIGVIPQTHRTLFINRSEDRSQLDILYSGKSSLEILELVDGDKFLDTPNFWHLSERVKVIKTKNSFITDIDLTEKVNAQRIELNSQPFITLDQKYIENAENLLDSLGLPVNSPFIALHVRNKSKFSLDDTRKAEVKNYEMAIRELISRDYWIVQFGTDDQNIVFHHPKVIQIPSSNSMSVYLTPYIIANAEIFITTNSGPTHIAPFFNTPVLQTNVIALGKNTCSLTGKSLHLPKKWKRAGSFLSLNELLNSPEGYSDTGIRYLNKKGIDLIENSPTEIYEGVLDILNHLKTSKEFLYREQIDKIRLNHNSPVRGLFAPSFVNANESWFLS
jgi:putative glycosyltransferase (TIGR04372 family)